MPRSLPSILRNSALQALNIYAATICNLVLIFFFTKFLGPEKLGVLVTSQAKVMVWAVLVDLGLYGGMTSALNEAIAQKSDMRRQGFRALDLFWRILFLRISGASLGAMAVLYLAHGNLIEIAFLPFLFGLAIQQTLTAYLNFFGGFGLGVLGNICGIIVGGVAAVKLILVNAPLEKILFAQSLGGFIAVAIILLGLLLRRRPRQSRRKRIRVRGQWGGEAWGSLVREAWPYAIIFGVGILWQRLDQLAATTFLGLEAGGHYALLVRLMAIPIVMSNAIYLAALPEMQRLGRNAPEQIEIIVGASAKLFFRYGWAIVIFIVLGIYAIIPFVFPEFKAAQNLLLWFIPGIWAYWLQNFLVAVLYSLKQHLDLVKLHAFSLAVYIGGLLVLPQNFGLQGVILSFDLFCLSLAFGAVLAVFGGRQFSLISWFSPLAENEKAFVSRIFGRLSAKQESP